MLRQEGHFDCKCSVHQIFDLSKWELFYRIEKVLHSDAEGGNRMKFLSYRKAGIESWGVAVKEGGVLPIHSVLGASSPKTLLDYIQQEQRPDLELEIQKMKPNLQNRVLAMEEIEILAPLVRPVRNVICVGKNYAAHVLEMDQTGEDLKMVKEHPVFFTKATNAVNGPYQDVPAHEALTEMLDYEGELGVVIGKKCTNLKENEAMDTIFGYTIINDITARDVQKRHKQWFRGKSLDGTCPMGPYLVTKDELIEGESLAISSRVNGELRQSSYTGNMIHTIPQLISLLSQGFTLEAGDIIATGTPDGVGIGFDPPRPLKKGDIVRVEIEKLGYIENRIV